MRATGTKRQELLDQSRQLAAEAEAHLLDAEANSFATRAGLLEQQIKSLATHETPPTDTRSPVIQANDTVFIRVMGTPPTQPIHGVFQVEPSGMVALGPEYGRAKIVGLSLEGAEDAVKKALSRTLRNPKVMVTYDLPARIAEDSESMVAVINELRQLRAEVKQLRAEKVVSP